MTRHIMHGIPGIVCPSCGHTVIEVSGIDPGDMAKCLSCGWSGTIEMVREGEVY